MILKNLIKCTLAAEKVQSWSKDGAEANVRDFNEISQIYKSIFKHQ